MAQFTHLRWKGSPVTQRPTTVCVLWLAVVSNPNIEGFPVVSQLPSRLRRGRFFPRHPLSFLSEASRKIQDVAHPVKGEHNIVWFFRSPALRPSRPAEKMQSSSRLTPCHMTPRCGTELASSTAFERRLERCPGRSFRLSLGCSFSSREDVKDALLERQADRAPHWHDGR